MVRPVDRQRWFLVPAVDQSHLCTQCQQRGASDLAQATVFAHRLDMRDDGARVDRCALDIRTVDDAQLALRQRYVRALDVLVARLHEQSVAVSSRTTNDRSRL